MGWMITRESWEWLANHDDCVLHHDPEMHSGLRNQMQTLEPCNRLIGNPSVLGLGNCTRTVLGNILLIALLGVMGEVRASWFFILRK